MTEVIWHRVAEKLPEDGQECMLWGESEQIAGPIAWSAKHEAWIDLFATPEAGVIFSPETEGLTHWAPADLFNLPEE